jgi:GntR family transcriptional regulator
MLIRIFEQDQTPIYQQIVNQVRILVSSGRLQPEEELPSIRALAEQLVVNPNTVARAYRELESAGIVTKRRTTGSYISQAAGPVDKQDRLNMLGEKVDSLLGEAKQLDLTPEDVATFVTTRGRPEATHHE